ncbi:hypothetical protein E4G67_00150 [Candidatus Bathyarchaeota archaeon]|nr:MAG: hypothetical protein E4G67_00150 [Candidatus Bathyarchaeota archaeon]
MPAFSDPLLIEIIIKAARRVNRKLCLSGTTWEITINPSTGDLLTPDPEKNQDLYDIVLMQAECLISSREFQSELRGADGGVLIRYGEQTTDMRGVGAVRGTFFNSTQSPCAQLDRCIKTAKMNSALGGGAGKLVW